MAEMREEAKQTTKNVVRKQQKGSFVAYFIVVPILVYSVAYFVNNAKLIPSLQNQIGHVIQKYNQQVYNKEMKGAKSGSRPLYYLPTRNVDKLTHVMEIFEKVGYDIVRTENYSEDWHVMWTFHNPFYARKSEPVPELLPNIMQQLKPHQKVNQIPGASYFSSKVELAKKADKFEFIPKSFVMPGQYGELMAYHKQADEKTIWIKKGNKHRGVSIINPNNRAALENIEEEVILQQLIKPLLIDGRMWDIGLYVAVTSVNPLRAYIYDNVLLRHCTQNYTDDIENAKRSQYVVQDDYSPPWAFPSLRDYFTWGFSTLNVLRAHLTDKNLDAEKLWLTMQQDIIRLLIEFQPTLARFANKYPHGDTNFFSLYRFDFIIDNQFVPWLTEVNQSPNLSSHHTKDLRNMFQRLIYSFLSLNGLLEGQLKHPQTDQWQLELVAHTNEVDIAYDICKNCTESCSNDRCYVCRRCRQPEQSIKLKETMSEHQNRQSFIRLYPPSQKMEQQSPHIKWLQNGSNKHLKTWIELKCRYDFSWC